MIKIILFVWILLTDPADHFVCGMWVNHPPTLSDMSIAGCDLSADQGQTYFMQAVDYQTGSLICEQPAVESFSLSCKLSPLDHYVLRIYEQNYQEQLCYLTIDHSGPPTTEEITNQCSNPLAASSLAAGNAHLIYKTSGFLPARQSPDPICPMPELDQNDLSINDLKTANNYDLLAFNLRWWYGQDYDLISWQNQLDPQILKAGEKIQVPPHFLKALLAKESQFWPLWPQLVGLDYGEVGMGRLTDNGADLVLRYSPYLYNEFCLQAASEMDCSIGYDLLSDDQRLMTRNIFRRSLIDHGTPRQAITEAGYQMETWARILAAYYCAAGEIVRPAGLEPSWDFALAAYYAGPNCVRGGDICLEGLKYLKGIIP